jgi:hypothetical protein
VFPFAFSNRAQPAPGTAILRGVAPLGYSNEPDPEEDVPEFVRAASGIRRWGPSHVVVQDDVNALVLVHAETPSAGRPVLLPRGAGGRRRFEDALGNKADKLDLEAITPLPDGRLLVLGSGSTPKREKLVLLDEEERVRVVDASDLYAVFHQPAFAGAQLNIEGAVAFGDTFLVLQRGNGAARDGLTAVNAIGELSVNELLRYLDGKGKAPEFRRVTQVDLGELGGSALGFTDAALVGDGTLAFLACAEASPDVVRDGEVLGNFFGWFDADGTWLVPIVDDVGARCHLKLEGLETCLGETRRFDVVIDADDASLPAGIGLLEVTTPIRRAAPPTSE